MPARDDMRLYGIDSNEGRARQVASVAEHYQMIDYGLTGRWYMVDPVNPTITFSTAWTLRGQ